MTSKTALSQAVRNHCLNCMSGSRQDVESCLSPECALYSFRTIIPEKLDLKELMTAIHENCRDCIGSEAEISVCTTDGSAGFRKCSLFDIRMICKQSTRLKPKKAAKPVIATYSQIKQRESEPGYEDEIKPVCQKPETEKKYKRIHCVRCDSFFIPKSNRAKYCPECAKKVHRKQTAQCVRKNRAKLSHCKQLEAI